MAFLTGGLRAGWWGGGWRGGGLITLLTVITLIAGFALAFTARYPRDLFDLLVGLNRWVFRVAARASLMTDAHPPFRLDRGGDEPAPGPAG
ncbi:DUF4389 domain-containing protein [Streptomyces sp. NPDC093105]|uniref:DUF4389 domain-containing protein n=1 Tax=Streptomyces sp. NPDC093105 TaxID=3366029 RepID=UPI00380206A8